MVGNLATKVLMLVQPTGSGKSSVPQTASVVTSGTMIIIKPTLALCSDQSSKFNHATNIPGGHVYSCQLDFQKNEEQRIMFTNNIVTVLKQKVTADIDTGIVSSILFTSPRIILLLSIWTKLIDDFF